MVFPDLCYLVIVKINVKVVRYTEQTSHPCLSHQFVILDKSKNIEIRDWIRMIPALRVRLSGESLTEIKSKLRRIIWLSLSQITALDVNTLTASRYAPSMHSMKGQIF